MGRFRVEGVAYRFGAPGQIVDVDMDAASVEYWIGRGVLIPIVDAPSPAPMVEAAPTDDPVTDPVE